MQDICTFAEAEAEEFYKCQTCKDLKRIPVFDECPHCEGIGCSLCDDGLVKASIVCPDCILV